MENKIIVIVGGTSGIGRAATQYLIANPQNKVFVLYRSESRLRETVQGKPENVVEIFCDLLSFGGIKAAVEAVKSQTERIDVLVNNAGIWVFGQRRESVDRIEATWQVNVLAPAYFEASFRDLLLKSTDPRVISTASMLHTGTINLNDVEFKTKFSGYHAYRQSKLSVVLLTRFWAKNNPNIRYFCFHPGVVNTDLGREANFMAKAFFKWFGISPKKGAETLLYLIESPIETLTSGEYYVKKKLTRTLTRQSYDMRMAHSLAQLVDGYLSRF
jgi:NAD(P)-dependent dehydrogenase (short-subunit alcohol dehydrogenase family)